MPILITGILDGAETELDTLPAPAWPVVRYGRQIGQVCVASISLAFSPAAAAEVGVELTVASVPVAVALVALVEECRGRVERALSSPAENRDAYPNMIHVPRLARRCF